MALRDQLADLGLSYEETAERLNERGVTIKAADGERPVTATDVSRRSTRPAMRSWREALELEKEDPPPRFIRSGNPDLDGDADERPEGPSLLPAPVELPFDGLEAKQRIELAYIGVGEGVGRAMRNPQIATVFRMHAPKLADKWIAAAKQNARVATIVTYVTAGGATGDLVIAHIMLAVSLLVVSGKVPIGGILGGLGPDAVVTPQRPEEVPRDRPAEPSPVRAVGDDAEAPPL